MPYEYVSILHHLNPLQFKSCIDEIIIMSKKQQKRRNGDREAVRNLYTLNKQQGQESFLNVGNGQQQYCDESSMYRQSSSMSRGVESDLKHMSQQEQSSIVKDDSSGESYSTENNNHHRRNRSLSKLSNNNHHYRKSVDRISPHQNIHSHNHEVLNLEMRIKQLEQENSLLTNSICTHEQRQQEMITKYSKLQANNKRLTYQLSKVTKTNYQHQLQYDKLLEIKTTITNQTKLNQQILAQIDKQNLTVVTYLKSLLSKIIHTHNTNDSNITKQTQSITHYLQKCIQTLKENRKNIHQKYSLQHQTQSQHKENISLNTTTIHPQLQSLLPLPTYETQRIPQLLKQNTLLKQQLSKVRQHFEKLSQTYKKTSIQRQAQFKNQQKLLCEKYNSAINQIKNKYKSLQLKIHKQQSTYQLKLSQIEKVLAQKQRVIKKLKDQLREANVKLDEIEEERFSLLKSSVQQIERNNAPRKESFKNNDNCKKSMKKYVDGSCLNELLLAENKDQRTQSISGYYDRYEPRMHEESFCEYRPQKRRKYTKQKQQKLQISFEQSIMRRSHINKKISNSKISPSISRQQEDIQKLNEQIEMLEKEILVQFEYSK